MSIEWLPEHKASLSLTHNDHKAIYKTIEEHYDPSEFVSEQEWRKAINEDSVWELHWYPETPVGFYRIVASSLEAIQLELKEKKPCILAG